MFKNMTIYRIPANWSMSEAQASEFLSRRPFVPLGSLDVQNNGWVQVRDSDEGLIHAIGDQFLAKLLTHKKMLPASVVRAAAKERAKEIAKQQGFAPGKKAFKEISEQTFDELLPRAFTAAVETPVWIDSKNGWLVVNTSSPSRADLVVKMLVMSFDKLPLESLYVAKPIGSTMTDWLVSGDAPKGFTIDQDCELRGQGKNKAKVKYSQQSLHAEEMNLHVTQGKKCTRLAMTWNDKISFVLRDNMQISGVKPLDILEEDRDKNSKDECERFDSDFILMAGEFHGLLSDLIEAFGGERPADTAE